MPTRKTRERSKRVYTLDEALGVLDALRGNPLEPAFILACFGSCRSGESLGVRTEEVLRWERSGTVLASADICRQMQQSGTEPVVRVMVEAPDHDTCQKYVSQVVEVIEAQGYGV